MNIFGSLIVIGLTFGICYLFDKGFTKLFRGKVQHRSGLSVRASKRYATFGIILCVLAVAALFAGLAGNSVLLIGGGIVLFMGIALITHYISFGVFYDEDTFILTTFGKKSTVYSFRDIRFQQLYLIPGGSTVVELHLTDGQAVSIHSGMDGAFPFLNHAFSAWCRQTGRKPEDCGFHDPANHIWFPTEEA